MADNQMDEYEAQTARIRARMDKIGRKIMIMSGKGGVGKTTVTVNLANALVDMGCRVGVLDTDLHGPNVAVMFGCRDAELQSEDGHTFIPVTPRENLKVMSLAFALEDQDAPVIWRGSLKNSAIRQFLGDVEWGELDYLLIDTPPGTGDEQRRLLSSMPAVLLISPENSVSPLSVLSRICQDLSVLTASMRFLSSAKAVERRCARICMCLSSELFLWKQAFRMQRIRERNGYRSQECILQQRRLRR